MAHAYCIIGGLSLTLELSRLAGLVPHLGSFPGPLRLDSSHLLGGLPEQLFTSLVCS